MTLNAMRRLLIILAAVLISVETAPPARPSPKELEFFETKIRPVLAEHCYQCHSAEAKSPKAGLRLDSKAGIRQGGKSGAAVVPRNLEKSLLLRAIRREGPEMPPSGKLPDAVIADFETWIRLGAPDPRDGEVKRRTPVSPRNRGSGSHPSATFWSFRRPVRPPVPQTANDGWARTDIDWFILARQEEQGLQPVDDADRRTLIRRATFDLIGLPPRPQDVADFVNDPAPTPKAFEAVVDRLLASRHFGERWGRHWLDVTRYAESTGHERNFTYPHAWRYREYVIESFNEDKPYDQFIREQIAGDLLPAENHQQAEEQTIGTGFLAMGPKNLVMGNDRQYWADVVDDQINVTTRAILGLTVACARCHDHKFDPIPTEDYYALTGIFHSTEPMYGTLPGTGGGNNKHPSELLPLGPNGEQQHRVYREHVKEVAKLDKQVNKVRNQLKKARAQDQDKRIQQLKPRYDKLRNQLKNLKKQAPPAPDYAMAVRDRDDPVDTYVLIRGNIRDRGDKVPRGFLTAVDVPDSLEIPKDQSGRLALARWLTNQDNPLTARVMVNRIWRHLFGRGLVPTPDNFGATGQPPSHPKLLDYLAVRFMDEGWSVKRMIRTIMLSRVYQLSSHHHEKNHRIDPDNVLLWRMRPRRLEAEVLRDAMLAVSGQLDPSPPPFGSVVAKIGNGCLVRQLDPDKLKVQSNRRSVYLPNCRHFLPEVLDLFDGAPPSLVVGDRDVTTVPAQSLYLLNNEFVVDQSEFAARRLLEETNLDTTERIELAYRRALGRPPTENELRRAAEHIDQTRALLGDGEKGQKERDIAAWASFCQALFTSAEFRYVY